MIYNKAKRAAASRKRRSSEKKGAARQLRVLNLHSGRVVDPWAQHVVDIAVAPKRHPALNQKISNYLLGFDGETQCTIAEALALHVGGHAVTVTCLPAVDALLRKFYREIDDLHSQVG